MKREGFNIDKAEALLKSKIWSALTEEERKFLSEEFPDEASYTAMRTQLLNSGDWMAADDDVPAPDPAILMRLQHTLELQPKPSPPPVKENSLLASLLAFFSAGFWSSKAGLVCVLMLMGLWVGNLDKGGPGDHPASSSGIFADSSGQTGFDSLVVKPILFIH